jgi:hypothetical protein
VHWRDWRQLCGVVFLRLEDFLDNACHQLSLSLVPQGQLFTQVLAAFSPSSLTSDLVGPGCRTRRPFETVTPPLPIIVEN